VQQGGARRLRALQGVDGALDGLDGLVEVCNNILGVRMCGLTLRHLVIEVAAPLFLLLLPLLELGLLLDFFCFLLLDVGRELVDRVLAVCDRVGPRFRGFLAEARNSSYVVADALPSAMMSVFRFVRRSMTLAMSSVGPAQAVPANARSRAEVVATMARNFNARIQKDCYENKA